MKIFNPKSPWMFGEYKKHKNYRGVEQNSDVANLGSNIKKLLKHKILYGSKQEQRYLIYIKEVEYRHMYINIVFTKITTLIAKNFIRAWLVKNSFIYKDKPYNWKTDIITSTKSIGLGPHSKKTCWSNYTKSNYVIRAIYK